MMESFHTLEPVIGLEVHVQLKTRSKMFCGCDNAAQNAPPNTLICPVCVGHPGTLPVPNAQALRFAVQVGLALGCRINAPTYFDRKHYLYPDLPKGYQISQFDVPICGEGALVFEVPDANAGVATVRIERAHLEEDAAKNTHRDGKTLVNFNRAGTPLVEIVTRPDLHSPAAARAFLQELRRILRYLRVSDADMEKGHLRCDANVSLRPVDADGRLTALEFYPKTEVKNMNSFRAVERALAFEIGRQTDLWHTNSPPAQHTTRGWDDARQATVLQRTKEIAADYRYMREPDIGPIDVSDVLEGTRHAMPELPVARRTRFREEYGFSTQDTWALTDEPSTADFVEATMSELTAWLVASPSTEGSPEEIVEHHRARLARIASTWIATKLMGVLRAQDVELEEAPVTPENMAQLMRMVFERTLNNTTALKLLEAMVRTGKDPEQLMGDLSLAHMDHARDLREIVERVVATHPQQVEEYRAGKTALLAFFMGLVQKETQGAADPLAAKELLQQFLAS